MTVHNVTLQELRSYSFIHRDQRITKLKLTSQTVTPSDRQFQTNGKQPFYVSNLVHFVSRKVTQTIVVSDLALGRLVHTYRRFERSWCRKAPEDLNITAVAPSHHRSALYF